TACFFVNAPPTSSIYTLSLHDALPIFSFQVFDTGKNQYIYGKVPYTEIEKCVISVHADPILVKRGKGRFEVTGYHYFPVVHIIYEENGERTYFARTLVSESTTMDMLGTLSRHGIPLEITDYDLGWVP